MMMTMCLIGFVVKTVGPGAGVGDAPGARLGTGVGVEPGASEKSGVGVVVVVVACGAGPGLPIVAPPSHAASPTVAASATSERESEKLRSKLKPPIMYPAKLVRNWCR
jgi:hypothetical protein